MSTSVTTPKLRTPKPQSVSKIPNITVKDLTAEPGATGVLSDYKDHTDPKYIGPGTWNVIHRRAFKARTNTQQVEFIGFMKDICQEFPCTVCRGHCTEYITNHPMEDYVDVSVDINGEHIPIGLFVWTWKFHNAVNARIKKPIMSWDTAYNLYSNTESLVCSKNCLETADDQVSDDKSANVTTAVTPITPKLPDYNTKPQSFRMIYNRNSAK